MLNHFPRRIRKKLGLVRSAKLDPVAPFGDAPRADRATYEQLYAEAILRSSPAMDAFLDGRGPAIDTHWMNELALHTQVVVKSSPLSFNHGRMLYSLLRDRLSYLDMNRSCQVSVVETGTARGFSALCMARALRDADVDGRILTFDILPHHRVMFWNCIDDCDGPRTRAQLLAPWGEEVSRVIFVSGDTRENLPRIHLDRIHFAFLDGAHTEEDVLHEFSYVADRQKIGDMIVLDDVTPGVFDGIVAAVDRIESDGRYVVDRLQFEPKRAYAIAVRR